MGSVYLVRHAQSVLNAAGRAQGRSDPTLSNEGRVQVARLATEFAPIAFEHAYTSPLRRAVETAEAIVGERAVPLELVEELREVDYGVLEGLTSSEAETHYPDVFRALLEGRTDVAPPGGDSMADVIDRLRPIVGRLRSSDGDALVVGHGGSIRAILVGLLDLPVEAVWRFALDLASVSVVDVHANTCVLRAWNDTSHLAAAADGRPAR